MAKWLVPASVKPASRKTWELFSEEKSMVFNLGVSGRLVTAEVSEVTDDMWETHDLTY